MSAATARVVAPAESAEAVSDPVEVVPGPADLILDDDFNFEPEPKQPAPEKPQPAPELPDPVAIAANRLVDRALEASPGLQQQAAIKGAVVILVTSAHWQRAIQTAWRQNVLSEDLQTAAEDEQRTFHDSARQARREQRPLGLIADRADRRSEVDGDVRRALRIGRGILIACSDPETEVGIALRAASDMTVRMPALCPADLAMLAESLGTGEGPHVGDAVAAAVEPDDLRCAIRPGQTAADYVERVARMVTARLPVPVAKPTARWTLDNLPLPEAVESWGRQLASDLRAYASGQLAWSEVDRGALLWGPPGTGKTTFASALAATCGVPLIAGGFSIWESGEDGKGRYYELMSRMRQAFRRAKEQAPAILFIDEIDSFVARGEGAHNDSYFTPIVNALLAELDGLGGREGVVVVAATNHPGRIDPALRRAGRLDRMLELELPAPPTVARILAAHLDGVVADDLMSVAHSIGRMSGADCERLARGARRRARAAGRAVTADDVTAVVEEERGRQPRSPEWRRRSAFHEAGHAVVASVGGRALLEVSIRPGGESTLVQRQEALDSHEDIARQLQIALAGRAAEELMLGASTAGSGGGIGSDLARATHIAATVEMALGMGDRLTWFGQPEPDALGSVLLMRPDIAARVETRLTAALEGARDMLTAHRVELDALAAALLDRETLTGTEAEAVIATAATRPAPRPRPRLKAEVLAMVGGEMTGGVR